MTFTVTEKDTVLTRCNEYILQVYPSLSNAVRLKCYNDLNDILNAIYADYQNDSHVNCKFICRMFFKEGIYELGGNNLERRVYRYMRQQLIAHVDDNDAHTKLFELANIFVNSVRRDIENIQIPVLDNQILDYIMDRKTCRSFSADVLPTYDQIQILKQTIIASPSKNNEYPFNVKLLGPEATDIKQSLYDLTLCYRSDNSTFYNPQILAPYVFLFLSKTDLDETSPELLKKEYRKSYSQSGIASAGLAITAKSMGLDTGYVGAIDNYQSVTHPTVAEWQARIIFAIGVGYARTDVPDKRYRTVPSQGPETTVRAGKETKIHYSTWLEEIGM